MTIPTDYSTYFGELTFKALPAHERKEMRAERRKWAENVEAAFKDNDELQSQYYHLFNKAMLLMDRKSNEGGSNVFITVSNPKYDVRVVWAAVKEFQRGGLTVSVEEHKGITLGWAEGLTRAADKSFQETR